MQPHIAFPTIWLRSRYLGRLRIGVPGSVAHGQVGSRVPQVGLRLSQLLNN